MEVKLICNLPTSIEYLWLSRIAIIMRNTSKYNKKHALFNKMFS